MPEKEPQPQFFREERVPEGEKGPERPAPEILKEKAEIAEKEIKEISPEEKKRLFDSVEKISKNIPEVIITGGTALRIYLENFKKKVPEELGKDIDCILEKEIYEKVREALPPEKEKEVVPAHPEKPFSTIKKEKLRLFYGRKEGEEETPGGRRAFLKDPENHMALEDKRTHYHIDIFPKQEITLGVESVELRGQKINLLSPEELLMRRMSQIKKGIEEENLQRRHISYFYLNGGLIKEAEMDKLWKKVKEKKEDVKDWREIWLELDKEIQRAEAEGKIKEKITH